MKYFGCSVEGTKLNKFHRKKPVWISKYLSTFELTISYIELERPSTLNTTYLEWIFEVVINKKANKYLNIYKYKLLLWYLHATISIFSPKSAIWYLTSHTPLHAKIKKCLWACNFDASKLLTIFYLYYTFLKFRGV